MGGYPKRGVNILKGDDTPPAQDKLSYLTLSYANGPGALNNTIPRRNLTGVHTGEISYVNLFFEFLLRRGATGFGLFTFQTLTVNSWAEPDLRDFSIWHTTVNRFCQQNLPVLLSSENLTWRRQFVGPVWSFSLAQNRVDRKHLTDSSINACRHVHSLKSLEWMKSQKIPQKKRYESLNPDSSN